MRRALAGLGLGLALAGAQAQAAGVFSDFDGRWRGKGVVSDIHGHSEPLTCKSSNSPSSDGIAMNLSLVCASDSYRVDFQADLYTDGSSLRGTWSEKTREATGNVEGRITPTVINARTTAPGFSADIVVRVAPDRKSLDVTLDAHGTNVNHVAVSMSR